LLIFSNLLLGPYRRKITYKLAVAIVLNSLFINVENYEAGIKIAFGCKRKGKIIFK